MPREWVQFSEPTSFIVNKVVVPYDSLAFLGTNYQISFITVVIKVDVPTNPEILLKKNENFEVRIKWSFQPFLAKIFFCMNENKMLEKYIS